VSHFFIKKTPIIIIYSPWFSKNATKNGLHIIQESKSLIIYVSTSEFMEMLMFIFRGQKPFPRLQIFLSSKALNIPKLCCIQIYVN